MTTDPQRQGPAEGADAGGSTSPKKAWLLVIVLVLAGLATVGGVAGIVLYDRATKVDRSDPEATVDRFLRAVFDEKDLARVGLFVCTGLSPDSASVQAVNLSDPAAVPSWDTFTTNERTAERAQVGVRMRFSYPGELAARGEERWVFELVDAGDGWRVCAFGPAD